MLRRIMTKFGKLIFTLIVLALAGFAVMRMMGKKDAPEPGRPGSSQNHAAGGDAVVPAVTGSEPGYDFIAPGKAPQLPSPRPYVAQDNTVVINLSEYAGYAGLIAANGGLEPNDSTYKTMYEGSMAITGEVVYDSTYYHKNLFRQVYKYIYFWDN